MDKERITSLLAFLDKYYDELKQQIPHSYNEYTKNIGKKRSCERLLQLLIEVCIDIFQKISKELKLGLLSEEEGIFNQLVEKQIISKEMAGILKEMKSFRNVLIHHYVNINDEQVYENLTKNKKDFQDFKKEIVSYLKEYK